MHVRSDSCAYRYFFLTQFCYRCIVIPSFVISVYILQRTGSQVSCCRSIRSVLLYLPHNCIQSMQITMAPIKPNPAKMLLRNEISARIAALSADEKQRQSQIVFEKVINHPWYKSSNRIALYMSTDQEVDTAPLIDHVKAKGAAAFVPQYAGGHMKMLHLEAGDEQEMDVTKHGIAQHSNKQARNDALESSGLDLIVAPGLAFSRSGTRLGHGGGYYDKYLAKVRNNPENTPKVIAIAFSCQIVDEVPVDEHDQKVDEVIAAD